mmetsp:Transcript_4629/g.7570  ORF Transcript_4629/g.7570 Transcript_4629/m.7570 type:complete len:94 (-) Transcript_4629:182-463(-)
MKCVYSENLRDVKSTKRFNATNTFIQLVDQYKSSERPSTPIAGEIYDAALECNCGSTLRNLNGELSKEITVRAGAAVESKYTRRSSPRRMRAS